MLKISGAVLSAALVLSTFAATAQAAMEVQVTDNVSTVTVADQGAGDTNPIAGILSTDIPQLYLIGVNNATITAAGSPAIGQGALDLNDLDIAVGSATTITVELSENNQTSPTGPAYLNQQFSLTSLSGNATVTLTGYENNSNTLFDTTGLATNPLSLSTVGGLTDSSAVGSFSSPYSLTEVATIVFHTMGTLDLQFTGNLSASPVPEPTSILLFGTVLAAAGLVMRKRFVANN
ncbi:MAG: PEP-CTERM sorting domain-containing protein [Acidobacteriaceae bacterium]|nr:PEP-CTERM sorting domain-containing protein [Acidobacteriaceae bacterium]